MLLDQEQQAPTEVGDDGNAPQQISPLVHKSRRQPQDEQPLVKRAKQHQGSFMEPQQHSSDQQQEQFAQQLVDCIVKCLREPLANIHNKIREINFLLQGTQDSFAEEQEAIGLDLVLFGNKK